MKLSSAHKAQLAKVTRVTLASAMVVGSVSSAFVAPAHAQLTDITVALSTSRPSTTATHTITFQPASGTLTAIGKIDIKWCQEAGSFTDTCTLPTGANIDTTSATVTGFAGSAGSTTGTWSTSSPTATFTITTPATETDIDHIITLPTMANGSAGGTKYVRIRTYQSDLTTVIDNGGATYAIVDSVTVSGTVLESMTFTVAAVTGGACGTGGATVTATTATSTTIPFGNLQAGTPRVGCHTVNTATNASLGFTTTVEEVLGGTSPAGAMCRQTATNCTADGAQAGVGTSDAILDHASLTSTAADWQEGTTTGFGVNANGGHATGFNGNATDYKSLFGSAGVTLASLGTPTVGANTFVVYNVDIPSNQTAGVYQNRLFYVSTPKF